MCGGEFSSSIRKNRDCLPSIPNAYDDSFLDKIKFFIEKAKMIEFLGGEPFLIPINIKLLELIKAVNPKVKIDIVSNGSIYTPKIETILKDLPNCTVSVSIDSINPETYKKIRRNGDLDNVIKNIDSLISIKRIGALSMCLLIQNIYEVHDFIEFCEKRNVGIHFNNVDIAMGITMYNDAHENGNVVREGVYKGEKIPEFRLWKLPKEEKLKIKEYLLSKKYNDHRQDKINGIINFIMSNSVDN
jgi:MoaA/NifB/PqqE/SkfB family radical SAM enzyme